MKKIFIIFSLTCSVLFLASCNGGSSAGPKTVLLDFFDAMSKKDIESVKKLTTADSKGMIDMMEMGMRMAKDSKEIEKYDKAKLEIGEPLIVGDKATVIAKEKSSGESVTFTLIKENGDWKVAFNMASMMQMAADKMQEKGISADSLKSMMQEMKNINMDSLQKGISEGMNALDSAKKVLKSLQK